MKWEAPRRWLVPKGQFKGALGEGDLEWVAESRNGGRVDLVDSMKRRCAGAQGEDGRGGGGSEA